MVCGTCGATIAAKAIVCYRCGTATAIPALPPRPQPVVVRPWLLIVALAIVAGILGWFASAEPAGSVRQVVLAIVGLAVLAWGGHLAWHGRRRRP